MVSIWSPEMWYDILCWGWKYYSRSKEYFISRYTVTLFFFQSLAYTTQSGSSELAMYTVLQVKSCRKTNKHFNETLRGFIVEIFLERPIVGTILTQFLPTTLFLVIRDLISFLKVNFIEVFLAKQLFSPQKTSLTWWFRSTWQFFWF